MFSLQPYLQKLQLPAPDSHKGQNGKLLIIGGSELFHAASKWSLDIASRFVDMVFYASVPSNNALIQQAKGEFWNGIVIERDAIPNYIEEADCVLIGPGMERTQETADLTNALLKKYPHKKWVIDAGALQMGDVSLFTQSCILTPHHVEWAQVQERAAGRELPCVVVVKGATDVILTPHEKIEISGGNAGMTKGGTGDVLAGLIAGLYTNQDQLTAAVVGSAINKKAGEFLWQTVGPNFNSSDLVAAIPRVLWREWRAAK